MVPNAIKVIQHSVILKNGAIESKYNGYISSFGASIIQAGLNSTIAFFEKASGEGKDRKYILDAIWELIQKENLDNGYSKISEFANNKNAKEIIMDAAVAMKLAIRIFEKAD